jgi:hypothetical protein
VFTVTAADVILADQVITWDVAQVVTGKVGGTITLSASALGSAAVTFSSGDAAKATVTGTTLNLVAEGTVTITASTAANATHQAGTATKVITITAADPTGVATQTSLLLVYPNPTTGVVYVDNEAGEEVVVYTLAGSAVIRTNAAVVDLTGYAAGVYIIKVGGKVNKVVKK